MITLSGYTIEEELYHGEKSVIFRGKKGSVPVILKYLNEEYPSLSSLEIFKKEYNLLTRFTLQNSVRTAGLENCGNSVVIVFEDIGAVSLSELLKGKKKLEVNEFLDIAVSASQALEELHANEIIHKDIKPHNIIYNSQSETLRLIDFGSASLLSRENPEINMRNNLEGTLAYISPEQTGRMNCNVDERTDFYSLGVTFFQLATGALPFDFEDPSELVHAHIALSPRAPSELEPSIPQILSEIILKLLSKSPEDRYQTASGLRFDLEECRRRVSSPNPAGLEKFQTGQKDISKKFKIPERLYGREKEIRQLFSIFERCQSGNLETVLVSGHSGIGKTALIGEVQKPIAEVKGYFIRGKYDKFKRNIPYRAIIYAFQDLCEQILTEPEEKIVLWKEEILKAVGANGKVITDVIPELETILGTQPDTAELGAAEAQNRFNMVFQDFLRVFCTKEHPLTVFLDDLQWADLPSLQLLQTILTGSFNYLFFIFSYRSNEVDAVHPFSRMLEEVEKAGRKPESLLLLPLQEADVTALVSDTLKTDLEKSQKLGSILHSKTGGNPFFISELFSTFYKDGKIFWKEGWDYNLKSIQETKVSENVLDLMVGKIQKLADDRISVLKLTACIGNWFFLDVLLRITGKTEAELRPVIEFLSNEGYYIIGGREVRFVHDKVVESVYSMLTEEERIKNHYIIGKTYLNLADSGEYDLEERIFTIVNQLNQGIGLMSAEEKKRLVDLNISAGNKALSSAAYETGLACYEVTEELISRDLWKEDYRKALGIFTMLARLSYLSKEFEKAEKYFSILLNNAADLLDKVTVYELKSAMLVSQNKIIESIDLLKEAIGLLGVRLPKKPTEVSPLPEIIKFKIKHGKKPVGDIVNLKRMQDAKFQAVMQLLNSSIAPSFIAQPALFPVIVLKMVNLSLKNGNDYLSPFGYVTFGLIQGSGLGDFNAGYEFGKMALELISKIGDRAKQIECRTIFIFTNMINHWKNHANTGKDYFLRAIQIGQETGDLPYTSYCINHLSIQSFLMRKNLQELTKQCTEFEPLMRRLKQYDPLLMFQMVAQAVVNFSGDSKEILVLESDSFSAEEKLAEWNEAKNSSTLFVYYTEKSKLHYFFGELGKAYEYSLQAFQWEAGFFGQMFVPEHIFFDSLICSKLYLTETDPKKKKAYEKNIIKNQKRMQKWAENCEANYGHKFHIIEGMQHRMKKETAKAIDSFEKAVQLANTHEYLLEEALANELAAECWIADGKEKYARTCLTDARYSYEKWGCKHKVKLMEEKYPYLKRQVQGARGGSMTSGATVVSSMSTVISTSLDGGHNAGGALDLNTVLKASQTISGEIQLGKLLEKMLKILFENAGAERGYFILKEKGEWFIEAEGNANKETVEVLQKKPLKEAGEISVAIANYVIRTKNVVLLHDAANKGLFVNDVYVKEKRPKSVLCYPVINQGNLAGLVYLENNLAANAFTPDRVEILKMLASQIAVSVENSVLYSNLEEKVEERTRDLNNALTEVSALKVQQDGDYFLNTLLIEPLGQNNAVSKTVQIDFFLKQKKKFTFRKGIYELGGDINISDNIKLNNIPYIVFLNGDAMGKSIQGAGGVLVLGTVFKSILQRTNDMESLRNMYPERWIKNAFIEMHKVFEGFDGAMLMSLVFGVLDETTGTVYYMNAEHPDPVIFRDGKAEFLPNSGDLFRKLGTQGQSGKQLQVSVFRMLPHDTLILGSDGRDDIIIGKDETTGKDVINQDEHLFLRSVEAGEGSLEKIYEDVMSHGQQFDDFSMLSITYTGAAVQHSYDDNLFRIRELISAKDFTAALSETEALIQKFPEYTEVFLISAQIYMELKKYSSAVDLAERVRLRDSKNLQAYEILLDSYSALGRNDRVKELVVSVNKLFPNSVKFQKFSEDK